MVYRWLAVLLMMPAFAAAQDETPETEEAADPPVDQAETDEDAPVPLLRDLDVIDAATQDAALGTGPADLDETPVPQGDVQEIFNRAQLAYATGDYEAAYVHARTAAAGGHAQAASLAGLMHDDGQIEAASDEQAARWYRRAASQGEPVGNYRLGLMAQQGRGRLLETEARNFFYRAAQAGYVPAMLSYALVLKASPVPQDADLALEWAERAATQDNSEAMFQLAQMLDVWAGGPESPEAARPWYERAGEAGHAEAALQAGLMAASGEGGPQDDEAALRYIRLSAESGFAPAMGQYGLMLYSGWNGAEPAPALAAEWFAQGAVGGDSESRYLYALALATGDGVERNLVRAYYWALMAEYEMDGSRAYNTDRDRLEAQLENALSASEANRIQSEVTAYRSR
ncbi:tetratricopeptide repeat protein [Hyphobacterium sp.]|uniref:tetratricopeptide repeat protein n=1 Tax=Hyphobacterium sp. TaxID=2004662 RepID=UPI003BAC7153